MTGFLNCAEKIGVLLAVREMTKSDCRYPDLWKARCKLIVEEPAKQATNTHYPKYPDPEDAKVMDYCKRTSAQLAMYLGKKGTFGRSWVMAAAEVMPSYLWWDVNGSSVPELQTIARFVLISPASASICERINGEFAFVADKRRNCLALARANLLVRLFHNLRLLSRVKKPSYAEPAVGWTDDVTTHTQSAITNYGIFDNVPVKFESIPTPVRLPALSEMVHLTAAEQLESEYQMVVYA